VYGVDRDAPQLSDLEGLELAGADEVVDGAAADVQGLGDLLSGRQPGKARLLSNTYGV
jgi:hypothetical protein